MKNRFNLNLDFDELTVINRVSRLLPWATPIYTAYLIIVYLLKAGVFWAVAGIEGMVVEGLGIVSVSTLLNTIDHNSRISDGEDGRKQPVWIAASITGFYYLVVIFIVVFLDGVTFEQRLINGLLASLSLVSAVLLGTRSVMLQQRESIAQDKAAERQDKALRRAENLAIRAGADKLELRLAQISKITGIAVSDLAQGKPDSAKATASPDSAKATASPNGGKVRKPKRKTKRKVAKTAQQPNPENLSGNRLAIWQMLQDDPDLTNQAISQRLGISHQAVSNNRKVLVSAGLAKPPARTLARG